MLQKVKVSGLHIPLYCGLLDFNPSSSAIFTMIVFFFNREEQNGQTQVQGKSAVISSVVTERLLFEWSQRILLSH